MSETRKKTHRLISVDRLVDDYQEHPSMRQVEILKDQLKREKQEDKVFYQSIKDKISSKGKITTHS